MPDRDNFNQIVEESSLSDVSGFPTGKDEQRVGGGTKEPGKKKKILSISLPWLVSLLFHVALFLVMFFVVFMVLKDNEKQKQDGEVIIPNAFMNDNPGGVMIPKFSEIRAPVKSQAPHRKEFKRTTKLTVDTGKTARALSILSPAGGSESNRSDLGIQTRAGSETASSFFGTGGNAHNIVYVIDRSGSMSGLPLELVIQEVLKSIGRLKPKQNFHIILFASGEPLEKQPASLVPATMANKRKAVRFLQDVLPEKSTDPIPALERAFEVLKDAKKPGKLIYLLTDGDFAPSYGKGGPGNEKVIRSVRRLNASNKVLINTILFMKEDKNATDVLSTIAKENRGTFKHVRSED